MVFAALCKYPVTAQMGNNWCFGYKAGISFNASPAKAFTSAIHNFKYDSVGTYFNQSYSNCKGELLLYIGDGRYIWNKEHKLLPSYSAIAKNVSQSIFLPHPKDDSTVVLLLSGDSGFVYYTIDLRLDSGRGDINAGPITISDTVCHHLSYVKHANDSDYWILAKFNYYQVKVYRLSTKGVATKPTIVVMRGLSNAPSEGFKISNSGTKVIGPEASSYSYISKHYIYDFNNANGSFSKARILCDTTRLAGTFLSFSPNDSIVYAFSYSTGDVTVFQIPAFSPKPHLNIKQVLVGKINDGLQGCQLGPDNKIYLPTGYDTLRLHRYLSYVPYPDVWGSGCGLVVNGIKLDSGTVSSGLDMPCYSYPVKRIANRFAVTGTNGCGYDTTRFTADADSAFKKYNWYFGDGDSAVGKSVVHQYKNAGSYYVKLGCELGNCGYIQWVGDSVKIKFKPTISLATNKTIYCGYQTIAAQINYRYSDTVQVAWGDGKDTLLYVVDTNLVDSVQLQHIYNKTGNYALSCKAWNSNCYDSVATLYNITIDTLPKASFNADYITSCGAKTIILTDTSKLDSIIINRAWHIYKTNGLDTTISTGTNNNLSFLFNDTGMYNVKLIVQSKQGCTDSLEKMNYIHINPFPVSKISGKTKWCGTDSTMLTVTGGMRYKWIFGDTTASVFLKPVTSNYYSVLVTNIYNCSVKDSVYISVGKIVTPFYTPDYLQSCGNSTITLTDSSGMDSIIQQRRWTITYPNNTLKQYDTASTKKLKLTVQDTGYYNAKLVYITKQGCMDSLTKTKVFRILPQPIVYIDSPAQNPLCFKDSFILTAKQKDINYPPLVKYKWNAGQITTQSIKVDTTNSYYVSATNAYGCGSQSNTVKISFLPQLFANIKKATDSLYVIATRPIVSYTWYRDSVLYNTTSSLFHPPSGRYYVSVVDGNGCVANSSSLMHIGVSHITGMENTIRVYPNPVSDVLYIDNIPPIKAYIILYDLLGKQVYSNTTNGEVLYKISIGHLSKGLYILSVGEEKVKLAVE